MRICLVSLRFLFLADRSGTRCGLLLLKRISFRVQRVVCSEMVPFQAVTRHHGDYSVMGTPSLQPFLKTYWLTPVNDWPIVAKHANMTSSRGSINAAPATIRQNLFLHLAEPRLWLKMVQLTVKVRSFEGRPHGCSSAAFR